MKTIFRCVIVTLLVTTFAFAKLKRDKVAVNNKFREDDTAAVVAARQSDEKKDCPCKCDKKEDKKWLQCLSGKYNGKEEKRTVLNMCQYDCWKCRLDFMKHLYYGYCKQEESHYDRCLSQLSCWSDGYDPFCMWTPESKTLNNICFAYCATKHLNAQFQSKGECSHSKDCKCKCGDKKDMEDTCVKGKWDGKPIENIIVSNMCMYNCWKCRMQDSFQICWLQEILKHKKSRNLQLGRLKSTEKLSSVNLHWYILQWYWNVMNNL